MACSTGASDLAGEKKPRAQRPGWGPTPARQEQSQTKYSPGCRYGHCAAAGSGPGALCSRCPGCLPLPAEVPWPVSSHCPHKGYRFLLSFIWFKCFSKKISSEITGKDRHDVADHLGLLEEDALIKIEEENQRLRQTQEQFSALREVQAENGLHCRSTAESRVQTEQEPVPPSPSRPWNKGGGRKAGARPSTTRGCVSGTPARRHCSGWVLCRADFGAGSFEALQMRTAASHRAAPAACPGPVLLPAHGKSLVPKLFQSNKTPSKIAQLGAGKEIFR